MISFEFLDQIREQICALVFKFHSSVPLSVSQNLIDLSLVPPPEASRFDSKGHHANAFTAALWDVNVCLGFPTKLISHIHSVLSLEPLASCCPSKDHLSPQTSLV